MSEADRNGLQPEALLARSVTQPVKTACKKRISKQFFLPPDDYPLCIRFVPGRLITSAMVCFVTHPEGCMFRAYAPSCSSPWSWLNRPACPLRFGITQAHQKRQRGVRLRDLFGDGSVHEQDRLAEGEPSPVLPNARTCRLPALSIPRLPQRSVSAVGSARGIDAG